MHRIKTSAKGKVISKIEKSDIIYLLSELLLSVLMALGTNLKGLSPFGIGTMGGIAFYGEIPFASLAGILICSLLLKDYGQACAALLFVLFLIILEFMGKKPALAGKSILLLLSQFISLPLFYNTEPVMFMYCFASMSLSFLFARTVYISRKTIRSIFKGVMLSPFELLPLLFLCAAATYCMGSISVFNISISALAAIFFTLIAIKLSGAGGAVAAILLGGSYAVSSSGDIFFAPILCMCAVLSSLCSSYGRWWISAVFTATATITVLLSDYDIFFIAEALIASIAYIMLPRSVYHKIEMCAQHKNAVSSESALFSLQNKLSEASDVICAVANMFSVSHNEQVKLANRQLFAAGKLMKKLSGDSISIKKKKRCNVKVGAAACPKAGNEETGDSIAIREYGTHTLLALSDGMGSGKRAHKESAAAVVLLADLLSIGFELCDALECVNMLMLQRSENDMYATVDAVQINKSTLTADFVKQGAPNSYIVRGDKVLSICSEALPIGILAQARAALCHMKLQRGDVIFIMTDGMSEAFADRVVDILADVSSRLENIDAIADELLYTARRLSDRDDMTVIAARII